MTENFRPRFSAIEGERPALARDITKEELSFLRRILVRRRLYRGEKQQKKRDRLLIWKVINRNGRTATYTKDTAGKLLHLAEEDI